MFTVKATYRGQTRKITFPNLNTFPTFEQLCNQLYRVFPISQNYYLSKLLFSPDSASSGRILLAKEVHSSDEYVQCLAQLAAGSWQNALLRFSVYEETPHKAPAIPNIQPWATYSGSSNTAFDQSNGSSPLSTIVGNSIGLPMMETPASITSPIPPPPPPPMSFFVPPPPIIYSSSPPRALAQAPMDVDPAHSRYSPSSFCSTPQARHLPPSSPPCACVQGKEQIQTLLTSFQSDLDRILTNTFGTHSAEHNVSHFNPAPVNASQSTPTLPPPAPIQSSSNPWSCLTHWCDTCMKRFDGPWFACLRCPSVQCPGCQSMYPNSQLACLNSHSSMHSFVRRACVVCSEQPSYPAGFVPSGSVLAPAPTDHLTCGSFPFNPSSEIQPPSLFQPPSVPISCQPIYTPAPPATSVFVPPTPSVASPRPPPDAPSMPCVLPPETTPEPATTDTFAHTSVTPPPPPVLHRGIICDACNKTIEGIRHKCLDCPDYDLCTLCISSGSAERHNPFHEFFEIAEPGRVVVHTVFSGDGERDASRPTLPADPPANQPPASEPSPVVVHPANCDLCDSRIRGPRFKCLTCPDFDTCSSCFSIVDEHHPHHSFVNISDPTHFIRRPASDVVMPQHYATCDVCHKGINGVRYKCMHPACLDFDLCQSCEALPIPVHPTNHPLLKMRSVDTVIPTVYRVGATRVMSPLPTLSLTQQFPHLSSNSTSRPVFRPSTPSDASSPRFGDSGIRALSPALSYRSFRSPSPAVAYSPPQSPAFSIPGGFDSPRASPVHESSPSFKPICTSAAVFEVTQPSPDYITPSHIANHLSLRLYPALEPAQQPTPQVDEETEVTQAQPTPYQSPQASFLELGNCPVSPSPTITKSPVPQTQPLLGVNVEPSSQTTSGRQTPLSHAPSTSSTASGMTSSSNFRLPPLSLDTGSDLFRELWPRVAQEFSHLLSLQSHGAAQPGPSFPSHNQPLVLEQGISSDSPLTGEALLSRPLPINTRDQALSTSTQSANALSSLAALLNVRAIASLPPASSLDQVPLPLPVVLPKSAGGVAEPQGVVPRIDSPQPTTAIQSSHEQVEVESPQAVQKLHVPLHATFIEDVTVPEGQIFPPGAEFVKSWRMLNDSEQAWPDTTELFFVAGETMSRSPFVPIPVPVGLVPANSEVELSTGELKAPEAPGRYVSYWRLRDANGEVFGDSIWIDITVQEPSSLTTSEAVSPASSIVVPSKAQSSTSIVHDGVPAVETGLSSLSSPVLSSPSSVHSLAFNNEEVASDDGSVVSSASLISVPSSPSSEGFNDIDDDDDEAVVWEDSRSHFSNERPPPNPTNMEYVLLFDENSSEEEL